MTDSAADKREQRIGALFNSLALRYDLMNTFMTWGFDRRWRRMVVQRSGLGPGDKALDVCCGSGALTVDLATKVGPSGQVMGVDLAEQMIRTAEARIARANLHQVCLIKGSALHLPWNDNQFNAVTVAWGLRNVPDVKIVLAEMTRVVAPGGKVISLDMGKPRWPVFRQVFWLYLRYLVPLMGSLITGRREAYDYLYESALQFIEPAELGDLFAQAGLQEVRCCNLGGGVLALVEGKKPFTA